MLAYFWEVVTQLKALMECFVAPSLFIKTIRSLWQSGAISASLRWPFPPLYIPQKQRC